MKKTFLMLLLGFILIFLAFDNASVVTLFQDSAVTTTNDSLTSSWIDIGTAEQVAIFNTIDDTMDVDFEVEYRAGTETFIRVALDSLANTGTTLTGKSHGQVLRGYGASAITNLIPGANFIRIRAVRQSGSETTGYVKSVLIYN